MTYTIQWSDNSLKIPLTLADNVSDNTSTTLTLTGRGFVNWGQPLQQNLMHLLENFASYGVTPTSPTDGQLWYNADPTANRLNLNIGTGWSELAFRRIDGSSSPTYITYSGDTWFDTTYGVLNVFNSATLPSGSWNQLAFNTQVMGNYSLDTGIANAYVVTLVPPIPGSYANNFVGCFKVGALNANTGPCTINAGGGAIQLVRDDGVSLVAGDLTPGMIVTYIYIYADNKAYVTSGSQSQADLRYAKLAGLNTQIFRVHDAVGPNDAVAYLQMTNITDLKAPLLDPHLTGVPTAPTAAPLTSTTQLATTAFTTTADAVLQAAAVAYVGSYTPGVWGIGARTIASSATQFTVGANYSSAWGQLNGYDGIPATGAWRCETSWRIVSEVTSSTTTGTAQAGYYSVPTSSTTVTVSHAFAGLFIRIA